MGVLFFFLLFKGKIGILFLLFRLHSHSSSPLKMDKGQETKEIKMGVLFFFQAAVDKRDKNGCPFHHVRGLIKDPADLGKRNKIDSRLAMAQFLWFEAENNIDHLISAYRLTVDLLGRCSIKNRRCFEGGLVHIVNAMKNSGLRFEDYARQTSVLGYLVKDGCGIRSWHHFSNLLYIRHKMDLTDADAVNKLADEIGDNPHFFIGADKKA